LTPAVHERELEYVGFWLRACAAIIDAVLLLAIIAPILSWNYGADLWVWNRVFRGPADFLIAWMLPAFAVVPFWIYRQATPGKMAIGARIVDAATGGKPTASQFVGRYLAYCLSAIPMLLGFIWVGCHQRKQGFHDMLAGTLVVRPYLRRTGIIRS
jgi:uncharacterized RDD family membrane protein YckC